jgi:hypothetical protein
MDVHAALVEHGMLLQSAKGPIPNVADLVAGEVIRGTWWGHPAGHAIFAALNELDESSDVVRLRLVQGKVTFVHRRLWPPLVRVADHFPSNRLAALREEHLPSGRHRTSEVAFPEWVPDDVRTAAPDLTEEAAFAELPACLRA